ncbi:MAG: restriction endonuclease subunit S [Pseudomonadota bacterium]
MSNSVPQGWKRSIFADVVKLDYGKSPKDIFNENGKYPVIGTGGVTGFTNGFLHQGSTTVIGRKGTINNPSFITTKFWPIDTTYFVSEHKNADPKWFYYSVQSIDLTKFNEASGVPSLNRDTLYAIPHVLPPLQEQQKIAIILTAVDDVIESTQAQINKLKDLKIGMMQELLTKGIGHTEFKGSPVGRIPKEWAVKQLDLLVEKIVDCEHKTAPYVDKSEFMVVRTNNVKGGQLVLDEIKFTSKEGYEEWTSREEPREGDVLFTREAPAGESCMVPKSLKVCMGQRMVLLRANKSLIDPEYFSIYLNSQPAIDAIFRFSIGTTVTRINIEDIRKVLCIVPPLSEQKKIAGCILAIQNSILSLEKKLLSTCYEKKALMQDLLTGKVRVSVN